MQPRQLPRPVSPHPCCSSGTYQAPGINCGSNFLFCCLNTPCHCSSPCALACEASLGDNYAPSGNLWGRCEAARQKYDIFNQLFHSLAPSSAPCRANLTRAAVKEVFNPHSPPVTLDAELGGDGLWGSDTGGARGARGAPLLFCHSKPRPAGVHTKELETQINLFPVEK